MEFWFRKKYNLTPKDERFLAMESWEIELEFLTYDANERALQGQRTEDYEMNEDEFSKEVGKMEEGAWEEVDPDKN